MMLRTPAFVLLLFCSCGVHDTARMRDAIARLDHDDVEVREAAQRELESLGPAVRPYLRSAHDEAVSEEQRARLDEILWTIEVRSSVRITARLRHETCLDLAVEGVDAAEAEWEITAILDLEGRPRTLAVVNECLPLLVSIPILSGLFRGEPSQCRLSTPAQGLSLLAGTLRLSFPQGRFASIPFELHGVK